MRARQHDFFYIKRNQKWTKNLRKNIAAAVVGTMVATALSMTLVEVSTSLKPAEGLCLSFPLAKL